jgi:hypothetical protein
MKEARSYVSKARVYGLFFDYRTDPTGHQVMSRKYSAEMLSSHLKPKHTNINTGDIAVDGKYGQASQAPTFAYKKWSLQNQDLMVDVISCGTWK